MNIPMKTLMKPRTWFVASLIFAAIAPDLEALPRDRAAGRQGARDSRQDGRQTSRARRRGCYGLPGGAAPFRYGGYNYYLGIPLLLPLLLQWPHDLH